jgi:metal-dependent amidase/aminoacylase/carboxypeptidase family protein
MFRIRSNAVSVRLADDLPPIDRIFRKAAADDVSVFLAQVPGLYFNLGIVPHSQDITKAAPNHSPDFFIDESALVIGVRALAMVTVNYLAAVNSD